MAYITAAACSSRQTQANKPPSLGTSCLHRPPIKSTTASSSRQTSRREGLPGINAARERSPKSKKIDHARARTGLPKCTNPRKHAVLLARGRHPPWPFALALPPRQEPELLPAARTSLVVVANRRYSWAGRRPLLHARIWFLWPMWRREQVPERNIEGLSGVPRRAYKFDQTALQESSGRPKSGNLSAAVVHNTSGPLNRTAPM